MRSRHLHWCELKEDKKSSKFILNHSPHWWICFRPSCKESNDYLCGLIADSISTYKETVGKNKRFLRG